MIARDGGFTHVELITAISVMSVLSAVAWPKLVDVGSEARYATMRSLSATLTQASVLNGAQGQLRGAAQPLRSCQSAGHLLVNATMTDDRMHWQGRELVLEDAAANKLTGSLRECTLRDAQDPAAGKVDFVIRLCPDQACSNT